MIQTSIQHCHWRCFDKKGEIEKKLDDCDSLKVHNYVPCVV